MHWNLYFKRRNIDVRKWINTKVTNFSHMCEEMRLKGYKPPRWEEVRQFFESPEVPTPAKVVKATTAKKESQAAGRAPTPPPPAKASVATPLAVDEAVAKAKKVTRKRSPRRKKKDTSQ